MKKNGFTWTWKDTLLFILGLIPVGIGLLLYNDLPDHLASHFGVNGEANGYMSKPAFFIVMIVLLILFPIGLKVVPNMDPRKKNYEKFIDIYELLRFVLVIFLGVIFSVTFYYNLGYNISMILVLHLLLGSLWIIFGNYMGRIRPNFTIGIRTPWTISNDDVWRKTHRLTGPLWVVCGIIMIIAGFIGSLAIPYVLLAAVAVSVLVPVIYSFLVFRNMKRGE